MLLIDYTHKRIRLFRIELNYFILISICLVCIFWRLLVLLRLIWGGLDGQAKGIYGWVVFRLLSGTLGSRNKIVSRTTQETSDEK